MDIAEVIIRIFIGVLLILANGFFVAIEFALTRARQFTRDEFIGDTPKLKRAWDMTQQLEIYLTTCQVGITASSIAVGIIAEPALAAIFEPLFETTIFATLGAGGVLAFLLINLVHLTHGEQTPTYLGVEKSRMICRYGATPLYWFNKLISPLIKLGDWVAKKTLKIFGIQMTGAWLETEQNVIESRADLRNKLGSILKKGNLSEERRDEVMKALTIGEQPIREIMVPEKDIVSLSTESSIKENFKKIEQNPHTRYPLIKENLTDFYGIIYTPVLVMYKDELIKGDKDLRDIAAPTMTLSPDTDISDAIDQFQTENQELGLVIEDGEVIGLVTVTDALEAVMGDIQDPIEEKFK